MELGFFPEVTYTQLKNHSEQRCNHPSETSRTLLLVNGELGSAYLLLFLRPVHLIEQCADTAGLAYFSRFVDSVTRFFVSWLAHTVVRATLLPN